MTTTEIRDNLRINITECRQINRDNILRSKRKALQDIVNLGRDVTDEEVVIIGNKLKSKSAVQIDDLALLKLAFVQKLTNIVTFLKVKGALHALVRELSSNKSNYQLVAAECCCNLALGDPKACLQVAKAAGPYLITLLSGSNYNLISISVWALGNLVGSDEKTWRVIHTQGFTGKLLQLIKCYDTISEISAIDDIKQNSLSALVQLLYIGSNLLTSEEIESITKTVATLCNLSVTALRVSEYLLSSMNAAEQILIECKVHLKCLKFLNSVDLDDNTVASFTPAVRTIANLVVDLSGFCALDIFSNFKLLEDVVQKIFSSPYPHLIKEVGWLLGNMMNHRLPQVQELLQEHSFDFEIFESQFAFFNSN